jgi:hypothetical protein
MAWTAAEAGGRALKGRPAKGGQNTQLISDPRAFFAKQFGASDKYVRMVRDLLAPVERGRNALGSSMDVKACAASLGG